MMNETPIFVGPRAGIKLAVLALAGAGLIGISLWLDQGWPRNKDDYLLPAGGLVLILIAAIRFVAIRLAWRTVTDTGTGMIVSDRRGTRAYSDEQVVQTAQFAVEHFENAKYVDTTRTFDAWVEERPGGEPRRVRMLNAIPPGGSDPLAALIERLNSRLSDLTRHAIERGMTVSGDRWSIDGTQLQFGTGNRIQSIRIDDITALRATDGQFCIWVGGDELPRFRFPINGGNAWLLASLVRERLAQRPPASDQPGTGLGRILFERRPSLLLRVVVWCAVIGMALAIPGWILAIMLNLDLLIVALILPSCACPVAFLFAQPYAKTLRGHELGVGVAFLGWRRELRYQDAISYTEKAVAHFHDGIYYGTVIDLEIVGLARGRQIAISYATKYQNQDLELENLRGHFCRVITSRWQAQLAEQQAVPWTKDLTFLSTGLQYQSKSLLRRPIPEVIPYNDVHRWECISGELRMYTVDDAFGKPRLKLVLPTANFYPGLALLELLCPRRS